MIAKKVFTFTIIVAPNFELIVVDLLIFLSFYFSHTAPTLAKRLTLNDPPVILGLATS